MANKALLVGINKYPGSPLRGCINDVEAMASFLTVKCGFKQEEIRLLVDERATRDEIQDRLSWLVYKSHPGDRLVFHYSGHGSRLAIRDWKGNVEALHDVICPVDYDFTPEHALSDEDFRGLFANIPEGVIFDWVSDSCHSGDLARNLSPEDKYFDPIPWNVPRSFPIPADIAWRIATAVGLGMAVVGFARALEHLHGILVSGCRSDQTSADAFIEGRYCGAATHYLLLELDKWSKITGGINLPTKFFGRTMDLVVANTVAALKAAGYTQEPQLRGNPAHTSKPWLEGD